MDLKKYKGHCIIAEAFVLFRQLYFSLYLYFSFFPFLQGQTNSFILVILKKLQALFTPDING